MSLKNVCKYSLLRDSTKGELKDKGTKVIGDFFSDDK